METSQTETFVIFSLSVLLMIVIIAILQRFEEGRQTKSVMALFNAAVSIAYYIVMLLAGITNAGFCKRVDPTIYSIVILLYTFTVIATVIVALKCVSRPDVRELFSPRFRRDDRHLFHT